ncbi:unnamed protein product, partial [Iphiclides podalirius]
MEVTCHFCGKYLKGRFRIYRHLKSHTDDKILCTICKKMLSRKSYKPHMQRHSGVKSYTCEKCAATFYTCAELCNHRRSIHNKHRTPTNTCHLPLPRSSGKGFSPQPSRRPA